MNPAASFTEVIAKALGANYRRKSRVFCVALSYRLHCTLFGLCCKNYTALIYTCRGCSEIHDLAFLFLYQ
jgi:hypothetical protein